MKPSVTKLIDQLDKPALLKWANKLGLQGTSIDDYRSKAKGEGTDIHSHVENYINHGIPSGDDDLDTRIKKFFSDKEVIETEKTIETDFFIGRYDIKLKWKDITFICDYKSNSKVYFETKLQLAGYRMSEECDHLAVIHLPEFILRPVHIDLGIYSQLLIHLSAIYRLKEQIENT